MPRLTLRRPREVYFPSLQHHRGPKTTRGFNRARACTRPTRPYCAARNRASPGRATNCARDAERRLARASCGPLLPSYHQPLRLHFRWASYSRRAADARPGRRAPRTAHPRDAFLSALTLPPRVVAALDEPQGFVSLEGLTLGLAGSGGGGATSQLPGLSPRNFACLRPLVVAALFLAGTPGSSWFAVLEALQNADYVLTTRGTAPPGPAPLGIGAVAGSLSKRGGTQIEGQVGQ